MPCRNDYDDGTIQIPSNSTPTISISKNEYEAGFCALVNAIDKNNGTPILRGLLKMASKNSGMDVEALYEKHIQKDIERLERDLHKYSHDELVMLKTILNKNQEL